MEGLRLCSLALCLLALFVLRTSGSADKQVCYYTNWAQYRPTDGKFIPKDIDPSLCTHIIYAFVKQAGNELLKMEWNDDAMIGSVMQLKAKKPDLKVLTAVGGWNAGVAQFSAMVKLRSARKAYIQSIIKFLKTHKLDGIDLDYEYPGKRDSPPQDKHNFVLLVKELKTELKRGNYLLTAAVGMGKDTTEKAYDIKELGRYLDFINLMTYDLHAHWDGKTGHNAPLHPLKGESGNAAYLNLEKAISLWVDQGVPKSKLVVGMPLYGKTFTLQSASNNGVGAKTTGAGTAGKYTREAGMLSYYEICDKLKSGFKAKVDPDSGVPYAYNGKQWISYDDPASLRKKVQWLKQKGLGGWMVWALDFDDFTGSHCKSGKYPLLHALADAL